MKLRKLCALLVCFSLVGLTACTDKKSKDSNSSKTIDTNAIQKNSTSLTESAENLALSAEQLMSPVSFMYADLIFDMALKNDPNNKRAQVYKTILKPLVYMKGSMKRIKPLLPYFTKSQRKGYNDFLKNHPESALRTFLLDGKEDLKTEKDVQVFLDGYRDQWEQVRVFMKKNKDLKLDLNLMTLVAMRDSIERVSEECVYNQTAAGVFEAPADCKYLKAFKIDLSRADVEILQQMAAGMQIASIISTAYDLNGTKKLHETAKDTHLTQKVVFENFRDAKNAGKLRNNELTKLSQLGLDLVVGTRWALKNQRDLCLFGQPTKYNRKGSLFKEGICESTMQEQSDMPIAELLRVIDTAATGGLVNIKRDMLKETLHKDGYYYTEHVGVAEASIKPSAILDNPIENLKDLFPAAYNECDNAVGLNDPSLGGLFPKEDGNTYLRKTGELDGKNCD